MFRTGIRKKFTARHALRGDFGTESTEHTHEYLVEWIVRRNSLDVNGFATDISLMDRTLGKTLAAIDDRCLNDLDYFHSKQPSLENLAIFLAKKLDDSSVPGTEEPMIVRIWESDTAWAEYETGR